MSRKSITERDLEFQFHSDHGFHAESNIMKYHLWLIEQLLTYKNKEQDENSTTIQSLDEEEFKLGSD